MTNQDTPTFGSHLRKQFLLDPKYVPLNHGSLGVYPKCVHTELRKYQDDVELHPDRWHRIAAFPELDKVRKDLATLMHVEDPADLVFVQNASMGVSVVLRSFPFEQGDKIICFSTTYLSVNSTLQYLQDTGRVELIKIDLRYPLSDDDVVSMVSEAIQQHQNDAKPIRMAVLDAIVSLPGVRFPFEKVTRLVQEHNILALVDGAHAVGQIPLDLTALDPDFFVTNMHKWLFTPRGSCVVYVAKRNQRLVHPFILNADYRHSKHPEFSFKAEFNDPGIFDFSPFRCVGAALKYRASLGGEQAIMDYCHDMAVKGGALVADMLGTSVMQNPEGTLIASMVNVELPLTKSKYDDKETSRLFIEKIIYEHHCMAPIVKNNGKWWVRLCGQIYTDLEDFKYGAKAIKQICSELQA